MIRNSTSTKDVNKKDVEKIKKLLENFPQLKYTNIFYPIFDMENKENMKLIPHTCETIHNLAYDDAIFPAPILVSAFMICYNLPVLIYRLPKDIRFDNLIENEQALKDGLNLKLKIDETHLELVKHIFPKVNINNISNVFVLGSFQKYPEKRIGVMNIEHYKKTGRTKLLERVAITKTNWASFAFILQKTQTESMQEKGVINLKYSLVNLIAESFELPRVQDVCPMIAQAASTLIFQLDIANKLYSEKTKKEYKTEDEIEVKEKDSKIEEVVIQESDSEIEGERPSLKTPKKPQIPVSSTPKTETGKNKNRLIYEKSPVPNFSTSPITEERGKKYRNIVDSVLNFA